MEIALRVSLEIRFVVLLGGPLRLTSGNSSKFILGIPLKIALEVTLRMLLVVPSGIPVGVFLEILQEIPMEILREHFQMFLRGSSRSCFQFVEVPM